ncbi:MAG: lysophospholipid acyltransferase family protein [Acidobacteriota bacterium]
MDSQSPTVDSSAATWSQRAWRALCVFLSRSFYSRFEVSGLENLPTSGPVILCANHVNALADAVVVQAAMPRPIHPIARSGLFRSPIFRPILSFIQAVPIARRRPDGGGSTREANEASFAKLFEYLALGRVILIFPEGQSHSDPSLRPLKTGAARMAVGHLRRTGERVTVVPVGLTFTQKGRFRSSVLVQAGAPVVLDEDWKAEDAQEDGVVAGAPGPHDAEAHDEYLIRRYTDEILHGLESVTLNMDSWQDLSLLKHLQHFFALRARRGDRPTLAQRFRSLHELSETHRKLRARWPDKVHLLRLKLERFEALCRRHGVQDYQLELKYSPAVVASFTARHLAILLVVTPIALWGLANSLIPYWLARRASSVSAKGRDQYDTAGMLFGLFFFGLFWGAQTAFVAWRFGLWPQAALYALSLPVTSAVALFLARQRTRILEEVRVFWLFMRRRELRAYLGTKRKELEIDVAAMARLAKRLRDEGTKSRRRGITAS